MHKTIITVLLIIAFVGCTSPSKKLGDKGVPTTVLGLLPQSTNKEKPIEETPPDKIPSYEQNRVYKEMDGFPDYIIGVGDIITISMLKTTGQESVDVKVPASGLVSFSFLDNVPVVGKTTTEVSSTIAKLLEAYVKRPRITVLVREYNSKKVFFLGEIGRIEGLARSGPGVYPLTGKTTFLKMIVGVGGHTTKADLNRVQFVREGKLYYINLAKIISQQSGAEQDIILENGDRILLPQEHAYIEEQVVKTRAYVLGEVKYPSLIESKADITVLEALSRAQGLTDMAELKHTRIVRGDINNPQVIPVDLDQLINHSDMKLNLVLQNGDVIFVPTTALGKFSRRFVQIIPIIQALTYPAIYRDLYTTGGELFYNTGVKPGSGQGGVSSTPVITTGTTGR